MKPSLFLCSWILLACNGAGAQNAAAPEFPSEATPITAKQLSERISDKVFAVRLADGTGWRLQYKASGYFFVNTTTGFNGSGKWTAEEGKLCGELKGAKLTCNEVRQTADAIYLKRDSGEIIRLASQ